MFVDPRFIGVVLLWDGFLSGYAVATSSWEWLGVNAVLAVYFGWPLWTARRRTA